MLFTYRVRRYSNVKFMMLAIFFMGMAYDGLSVKNELIDAFPFFPELYYAILMIYGIVLIFALARFLINAPYLWGCTILSWFFGQKS